MNAAAIAMLEKLLELVTAARDLVDELLDMVSTGDGLCSENESTRKVDGRQ